MIKYTAAAGVAAVAALVALTGCNSSTGTKHPASSHTSASVAHSSTTPATSATADPAALVWTRYGDCLTKLHSTKSAGVATVQTDGSTLVKYGRVSFRVTTRNGRQYTVPATAASTTRLAAAGC